LLTITFFYCQTLFMHASILVYQTGGRELLLQL